MGKLDLSTLDLPTILKGDFCSYKYFIIAEQPYMNLSNDEFIFVPGLNKNFVTSLYVAVCETDILKLFYDKDRMVVIPQHDADEYGKPIFTRPIYNFVLKDWECPENFFWSYNQAQEMLNLIKKKCRYRIGFNNNEFSLIKPYGHFNNF